MISSVLQAASPRITPTTRRGALPSTRRRSVVTKTRAPCLRIMAANLVNEDLWEKVILQAGPGEMPALNREMAAALRRDTLYKAFAARRAPRLWGALGAAPPGRDRFRRAVLLESDMVGPVGPRGTVALQPWTCIVVVTQGDAEVFRARCPFAPRPAEEALELKSRVICLILVTSLTQVDRRGRVTSSTTHRCAGAPSRARDRLGTC